MPVSRDRHNSADHFLYITRADVQIKGITASLGCKFYYSTVTPSNKFHTPLLTGVKTNWVRVLCWHRHCKQIPLNYYVNPFPQTNSFSHRCKIFEAIGIKSIFSSWSSLTDHLSWLVDKYSQTSLKWLYEKNPGRQVDTKCRFKIMQKTRFLHYFQLALTGNIWRVAKL